MLREAIDERSPAVVRGFRHRGHHHVSRIESFSDAVFGFSLTLLVVSLQVPQSFAELMRTMEAFPGFALSFAMLAYIWFLQYRFFRRYGMEDPTTIWLNMYLLFVVVFFTYPLKFMARMTFSHATTLNSSDVLPLYGIYDSGYAAVFFIFAMLYGRALRKRNALELTPLETFDTKVSIWRSVFQIGVAGISLGTVAVLSSTGAYTSAAYAGGLAYPVCITFGMAAFRSISGPKRRAHERAAATR
ncbi:MAG: DUF1211 domain-containing protein [Candidatus Eremiobacteraeota bacterium]|nr:DUF1211 domain-containing protein [Candidatus Eremiobacteraeota bacterium]MBC5802167.1 DUF1211 domain-containing protein [Candidatus Eremiobacteraeota bacterium]MBC5821781.1 DUF1211 domain-containing protein [Candidatus Eremiobacteraeota bacterium]